MISLLIRIAQQWARLDGRKFGVGDISLAGGPRHPDHASHRSGMEVDIRPIRKDGMRMPCIYRSSKYDREATAKLIALFNAYAAVKKIYFNDAKVPGVTPAKRHDNHFHVEIGS